MEDRKIYKVVGSQAQEQVEKIIKAKLEYDEKIKVLLEEYGAIKSYSNGSSPKILGVEASTKFDAKLFKIVDKSMTRHLPKNIVYIEPNKRTKAGKELAEKMSKITFDSRRLAQGFFKGCSDLLVGNRVHFPTVFYVESADVWIVAKHEDAEGEPISGLEEIKLSEYYAMYDSPNLLG